MGLLCKEHDFQAEVCRARMLQATEAQKSRSLGGHEPANSRACTSLGSVIPTQVSWGQSVRSQGWKQIKGSFIQENKQQLGQKESLNRGHLGEKYKVKM